MDFKIDSLKIYLIPYDDDKNFNKKIRKAIHNIFNKLNEQYEIGFFYDELEDHKYITCRICHPLIPQSKIKYFEDNLRRLLHRKDQKKKKFIIEI